MLYEQPEALSEEQIEEMLQEQFEYLAKLKKFEEESRKVVINVGEKTCGEKISE